MKFEWDPNKNERNLKKHGIDFSLILPIFNQRLWDYPDEKQSYGENRRIAFGELENRVFCVVYTERNDKIRLISARRANQRERKRYHEQKTSWLGEDAGDDR